jgi:hypothetical protein
MCIFETLWLGILEIQQTTGKVQNKESSNLWIGMLE